MNHCMSKSRLALIFAFCLIQDGNSIHLHDIIGQDIGAGQCPDGFTGLTAHPVYCPFYFLCVNGNPHSLRECPPGLWFNSEYESCDHPERVDGCQGGTRGTSTTISSPSTTTVTQEPEPGTSPIPEESSTSSVPLSTTPEPVPSVEPTTEVTEPSTQPGPLMCPPNITIFMPYPGDCTKYVFCQDGRVVSIHSCQSNLWFRFLGQVCVTPWGTDCSEQ